MLLTALYLYSYMITLITKYSLIHCRFNETRLLSKRKKHNIFDEIHISYHKYEHVLHISNIVKLKILRKYQG